MPRASWIARDGRRILDAAFIAAASLVRCAPSVPAAPAVIEPRAEPSVGVSVEASPRRVPHARVVAHGRRACLLKTDGRVMCWGDEARGVAGFAKELPGLRADRLWFLGNDLVACDLTTGDGSGSDGGAMPLQFTVAGPPQGAPRADLEGLDLVVANGWVQCGIRQSQLVCWGVNRDQLLGGPGPDRTVPERVEGVGAAVSVGLGSAHACAALRTGEVTCWGSNRNSQIGDGTRVREWKPPSIVKDLTNIEQVVATHDATCARSARGRVSCWGASYAGALGSKQKTESEVPIEVQGLPEVKDLTAATDHVCALTVPGEVWCWGRNESGEIGDGTTQAAKTPVRVAGLQEVVSIAAGDYFTCAALRDESVHCWGDRANGRVGDGGHEDEWSPVDLEGTGTVSSLCATTLGFCGVTTDLREVCWGSHRRPAQRPEKDVVACDGDCQVLGDGRVLCEEKPIKGMNHIRSVSWGTNYGCALRQDGAVLCRKRTDPPAKDPLPTVVLRGAVQVATDWSLGCALNRKQEIVCWGDVARRSPPHGPIVPMGGEGVVALSLDRRTPEGGCVVYGQGKVSCWYWALAVMEEGKLNLRMKPREGISDAVGVAGGAEFGCANLRDGRVQCWGPNRHGQLGDGTDDARKQPVFVSGLADAMSVAAVPDGRCAVRRDGRVACWGNNSSSELGVPYQRAQVRPKRVVGLDGRSTSR